MIHEEKGGLDRALSLYERSLAIKEEVGNRPGSAISLHQIGIIHQLKGDFDRALSFYERSLAIEEEVGNRSGAAKSRRLIAMIQEGRGEFDRALASRERALLQDVQDAPRRGRSLGQSGWTHEAKGEHAQALACYTEALSVFEAVGMGREAALLRASIERLTPFR
jgi:tetratricopeptide (TPR) repeat protein